MWYSKILKTRNCNQPTHTAKEVEPGGTGQQRTRSDQQQNGKRTKVNFIGKQEMPHLRNESLPVIHKHAGTKE